jgi:probable F420-dependent oxidoreductase
MKIGIVPVNVGVARAEHLVGLAQKAEEVGIESVWTFEHVIVPLDYASRYPYSPTGKMGATPETNFVDPLIALATIAASTERVRLATGVNILPQTNPLYLAKQAASLDFVSNGRFMLGIGIGWLKEEFEALGVPFEKRGARYDDYIVAMKKIWSGEEVEHSSEFIEWSGFKSYPVPVQQPHLPLVIGGSKGNAFRRVARFGDGYFAPNGGVEQMASLLKQLDEACREEGRDRSTIEITGMWAYAHEGTDVLKAYEDLGVDRLVVPLFALGDSNPISGLEKLAKDANL